MDEFDNWLDRFVRRIAKRSCSVALLLFLAFVVFFIIVVIWISFTDI